MKQIQTKMVTLKYQALYQEHTLLHIHGEMRLTQYKTIKELSTIIKTDKMIHTGIMTKKQEIQMLWTTMKQEKQ